MSQLEVSKAEAAEERSEQTRSFVRTVKAAARRKYTSEEKIRIVLEGFRREVTVNDLCRREGIKPHSYYSWTKEFMEAGKERLFWRASAARSQSTTCAGGRGSSPTPTTRGPKSSWRRARRGSCLGPVTRFGTPLSMR